MGRPQFHATTSTISDGGGNPGLSIAALGGFCITSMAAARATKTASATEHTTNAIDNNSKKNQNQKRRRKKQSQSPPSKAIFEGRELVVVTNAKPIVRETLPKSEVIVRAQVIPEGHPSHSSSSASSPGTKNPRSDHHREQHSETSTNSGSVPPSLVRIVFKATLLLVASFSISMYLEYFEKHRTPKPNIKFHNTVPAAPDHSGTTAVVTPSESPAGYIQVRVSVKQNHDESAKLMVGGYDESGKMMAVDSSKIKSFFFPDKTNTFAKYHNIDADAREVFLEINARASREKKRLAWLGHTDWKFILGVSGEEHYFNGWSEDGEPKRFLLCHRPLGKVMDEIGDGDLSSKIMRKKRGGKPKHTGSGSPLADVDDEEEEDDDENSVDSKWGSSTHNTIRDELAASRKIAKEFEKALYVAAGRGFVDGNFEEEGYCHAVSGQELRRVHHFRTTAEGKIVYTPPKTGSPYEGGDLYD